MTLQDAIFICHVRSAVMRTSKPEIKYWKNHPQLIVDRVPVEDAAVDDWVEYDPRDYDSGSLAAFND